MTKISARDPATLQEPMSVTSEQALGIAAARIESWRSSIRRGEPRLGFPGADERAAWIRRVHSAVDSQTLRRKDDFRRVLTKLIEQRWLFTFAHNDIVNREVEASLGQHVPVYAPWRELVSERLIAEDARQELWQRDVGDAMAAYAIGAEVFPDLRPVCRERLKAFVDAAIRFPTWGAGEKCANMDLSADHLARGIALAMDWHADLWSGDERSAALAVLRERVSTLLSGAYGAAFWANHYSENHSQIAYSSLGICGVAFLDIIPEAAEWLGAAIAGFEQIAQAGNPDGSSVEGVPYWSYGMTMMLQYIEWTRHVSGAAEMYNAPCFQKTAHYRLHCSLPNLSGIAPFGDSPPRDYYGPSHILYALAREYRDSAIQWLGDNIAFSNRSNADVEACALLWRDVTVPAARPENMAVDIHLPDWDVAFTRSGWSSDDYALAVKSGFTNRNHCHLDAGSLLLGWGDEWLIEAPGYGKVGPGFWDAGGARWTYYSNSTESHTTLLVGGVNQRFGRDARGVIDGFRSDRSCCWISVDLTGAYEGVARARRQVLHRRGAYILILDEVDAAESADPVRVEFLLQPGRTTQVEARGDRVLISGKSGAITVQALEDPREPFAPRAPRSPNIDIPREAIRTLARGATGWSVAFATWILPADAAGASDGAGALKPAVDSWEPGARAITVSGANYVDGLDSTGASW